MHLNDFRWLKKSVFYLAVIICSAAFFGVFQWSNIFADPDSFYHARITSLLAEQGFLESFPWLSATRLAEQFTDQHLLYHILLMPFMIWLEPLVAVKVGQVVFITMLTVVLVWTLRSWKLPYSGRAVFVLYLVGPFLFRMNLVKATPLALLMLVGIIALLLHKKYKWAAGVALLYSWVHGGFILALILAGGLWIGDTSARSVQAKRLALGDPRTVWVIAIGLLAGLILNPYFPGNLIFIWEQVVQIGFVNYAGEIEVGAEWYPFSIADLIAVSTLVLLGGMAAVAIIIKQRRTLLKDNIIWSLALVSVLFIFATLRSRRYIEYLVPFLWLWSCYVVLPYIASGQAKQQIIAWRKRSDRWFYILGGYCVGALIITALVALSGVWRDVHDGFEFDKYQAASAYIQSNAPPNAVVFHADWDDFPILFYHNPDNYYIVGLDATFMYLHDRAKYQRWLDIGDGTVKNDVALIISNEFDAEYVFIDRDEEATKLLNAYLQRDPKAELAFEDDHTRVYHIVQ